MDGWNTGKVERLIVRLSYVQGVLCSYSGINPHFLFCSEPNLLVRACNQLGQFLQHRETNLRYLALESMCTLASSEFSHEAVKTHIETVINALKVRL